MDSDIPLWVKILCVFLAAAAVFLLAAGDMVLDWISHTAKGLLGSKKRKL
jgi:hypothetical protein